MLEQWKPVYGFEMLYEVSNTGLIKSLDRITPSGKKLKGRMLRPGVSSSGRLCVVFHDRTRRKTELVHRVVLIAFSGLPKLGQEACHNDGDHKNNTLANLRWDSRSGNQRDRVIHGTSNRGEQAGNAKLTTEQVLRIRSDGRIPRLIAKDYGMGETQIRKIIKKLKWSHV